MTTRNVS